ncbi:MAG: LCP family protein [Bacillota bacterium]
MMVVGLLLLGAGLLMSAAFYGYFRFGSYQDVAATTPQDGSGVAAPQDNEADHRQTILVLGVDAEGGRSDTMILVTVDKDSPRVSALWIPRDTRVLIPGNKPEGAPVGWDKINAANAYWTEDMNGHERAMQTVANLLGVRVDDFVQVRLSDFERIVDGLGGVDINVPFNMDYDDPTQNFHVHLKKGRQHLNGAQALGFVRWRHNNDETIAYQQGDVGRISTQQQFAAALLKQLFQTRTIARLPSLVPQLSRGIKTSLDLGTMLDLARRLQDVDLSTGVVKASLPGTDSYIHGGSYWVADPEQTRQVVDWVVRGKEKPAFIGAEDAGPGAISVTPPKPPVETPGTSDGAADGKTDGGNTGGGQTGTSPLPPTGGGAPTGPESPTDPADATGLTSPPSGGGTVGADGDALLNP